jgi:hypothetical protein
VERGLPGGWAQSLGSTPWNKPFCQRLKRIARILPKEEISKTKKPPRIEMAFF